MGIRLSSCSRRLTRFWEQCNKFSFSSPPQNNTSASLYCSKAITVKIAVLRSKDFA